MIQPRAYQLECLGSILERCSQGITRQLVSLPTGCGKTIVFATLAKTLQVRTLVIAHTEELISQAKRKFVAVWPEATIGIMQAALNEVDRDVVIASIQTAHREKRLQSLLEKDFELLIIDEAHHAVAPTYKKLVERLGFLEGNPRKLLVGLTATPRRGDGGGLGSIFQEITFQRSISTMIRAGYLCPLIGKQIVTKTDLRGIGLHHGDFVASQLSRAINTMSRNELIVENFLEHAKERMRAIAFCADVQHSKDLADVFCCHGISSTSIYGNMDKDERRRVLSAFSRGEYQVLTNCAVLTEGFDEEAVDCIILARPTASESLYVQAIGRGTRIHPLKRNCLVLDFCDNSAKHKLCTFKNTLDGVILSLNAQNCDDDANECDKIPNNEICENIAALAPRYFAERIADIEFFDRAEFAWVAVGDAWHLHLANDRDIWVRRVEEGYNVVACENSEIINLSDRPLPENYALGMAEDWARSRTTKGAWARKDAEWRGRPATPRQRETLMKFNIQFTQAITCGEAAQLLDAKINEPATTKQKWWLTSHGVTFDPGISKLAAVKLISNMMGNNER